MGIEIPGWLRSVASIAVGEDWPDGDETAMRRVADAWTGAAQTLNELDSQGAQTMSKALAEIHGDTHDAMDALWQQVGGEGAIGQLVEFCEHLADTLEQGAADIEKAKIMILAALAILAAELAAAAATLVVTFGASSAAGAAAEAATQVTVRMILRELVQKLLSRLTTQAAKKVVLEAGKHALKGALTEGGLDAGIQAFQVAKGDRKDIDWKSIGTSSLSGAADEVVSGGVSGGLGGLVRDGASPLTRTLGHAGAEAAGGAGGSAASTAVTGDDVTWNTLTSGAISGGVGGVREGAGHPDVPDIDTHGTPESTNGTSPASTGTRHEPGPRSTGDSPASPDGAHAARDSNHSTNNVAPQSNTNDHSSGSSERVPTSETHPASTSAPHSSTPPADHQATPHSGTEPESRDSARRDSDGADSAPRESATDHSPPNHEPVSSNDASSQPHESTSTAPDSQTGHHGPASNEPATPAPTTASSVGATAAPSTSAGIPHADSTPSPAHTSGAPAPSGAATPAGSGTTSGAAPGTGSGGAIVGAPAHAGSPHSASTVSPVSRPGNSGSIGNHSVRSDVPSIGENRSAFGRTAIRSDSGPTMRDGNHSSQTPTTGHRNESESPSSTNKAHAQEIAPEAPPDLPNLDSNERPEPHYVNLEDGTQHEVWASRGQLEAMRSRIAVADAWLANRGLSRQDIQPLLVQPAEWLNLHQRELVSGFRHSFPDLDDGVPLQKVVHAQLAEARLDGSYEYAEDSVHGSISAAADTAVLSSPDSIFDGLALDYDGTPFRPDQSVYAMRFAVADPSTVHVPDGPLGRLTGRGDGYDPGYDFPFTGTGFTASSEHTVPEYFVQAGTMRPGAEMYRIDPNGRETLVAVINDKREWVRVVPCSP